MNTTPVQGDWNEKDYTSLSYIHNKPSFVTETCVATKAGNGSS